MRKSTMQSESASYQTPVTEAYLEDLLRKFFNEAENRSQKRFERLEDQLGAIQETLSKHAADIESQRTEVASIKTRVLSNEDTILSLTNTLTQMEKKVTDLEDRSRRDNIRIININEGEEGNNALSYLSANIPKWFPSLAANPPDLMRAHRIGPSRQSPRPRAMIVKCLRFTDRDRILNEARKAPLQLSGNTVRFAPDYSDATAKLRRPCYPIMYTARKAGFEAFLIYPAKIKLSKGSQHHFFDNPAEAEKFISAAS
ncbi:unnamed protein product [Knipowitschia caucasica]